MSDQIVTRLITSIEIRGAESHDARLDQSISKIRSYEAVSSASAAKMSDGFSEAGEKLSNSIGSGIGDGVKLASGHLASLNAKFTEGQATIRGYDAQIATARSDLALLNQKITEASHAKEVDKQAVAALKAEYNTLSASTRVLVSEKGKLIVESRNVGAAIKIEEAILRSEIASIKARGQAFDDLGIKSQAALRKTATEAQQAFNTIKNSGTASIADISRAWEAKQGIIDSTVGSWSQSIHKFGDGLSSVGQNLTTHVTLPLLAAGAATVKYASDADESLNKARVVFGSSFVAVENFAKTSSTALGLSNQKTIESTSSFGNLFKTMGLGTPVAADMSIKIVRLASDLASFHNIRPEDALEKLRSGLVGEAEPMRTLGVLLNETTVKAKAAELGFKAHAGQLTESQKVQARYALILEQTTAAQGDFQRTSDGVANSSRIVKAQFEDLAAGMGKELLPLAKELGGDLKGLLGWFNNLDPATKTTAIRIAEVAAVVGPSTYLIGKLTGAVSDSWRAYSKVVEVTPSVIKSLRAIDIATAVSKAGWLALAGAAIYAVAKMSEGQPDSQVDSAGVGGMSVIAAGGAGQNRAQRGLLEWITGAKAAREAKEKALKEQKEFDELFERETMHGFMRPSEPPPIKLPKIAAGSGKAAAHAALDEYKAGFAGFSDALVKVLTFPDLSVLFDPVTKGARAGAEQTKKALQSVASGINEYFQSFNAGITVTPELLATFPKAVIQNLGIASGALMKGREEQARELIALNEAYRSQGIGLQAILKDNVIVIQQSVKQTVDIIKENSQRVAQADNLTKVFQEAGSDLEFTLNERNQIIATTGQVAVKSAQGVNSELTASLGPKMFKEINLGIAAEGDKLASTFIGMWDNVKDANNLSSLETVNLAQEAFSKLAPDVQNTIKQKFDQYIAQLSTLKAAIADLKTFIDRSPIFANLRVGDEVLNQLDRLAATSGQTSTEVQVQFRNMLAQMGNGSAEMQQLIAQIDRSILNSQLAKLEQAWGQPLGRAIEACLAHYNRLDAGTDKLHTSTLSKLTAVGELFGALPGKLGSSVNKVLNDINSYVNLATKALNVLQAFGVSLPKPISDALKILNGDAQSTAQIMQQMKTEVVRVMQDMANQVEQILQRQELALNKNAQGWANWSAQVKAAAQSAQSGIFNPDGSIFLGNDGLEGVFNPDGSIFLGGGEAARAGGEESGGQFKEGFLAQVATIGSGIAAIFAGHAQGGIGGALTGALGGLQAGATIGSMIYPGLGTAIGAIGGAAIGFFAGIFGGGKSELQKAQEAAQLQQAKDAIKLSEQQVAQSLEATKQAIAKTASDVATLAEQIERGAHIPKKVVRQFAEDVGFILHQLAKELNKHIAEATPELKAAAENMQPVIALAESVPAAASNIGRSIPIAEASFTIYFSNLDRIWEGFAAQGENTTKKARRKAEHFAESWQPVVDTINPSLEAMSNFFKVRKVNESDVAIWVGNITVIEKGLGDAALSLDKYAVRQAEHLAESGSSVLDFIGKYADTQEKVIGVKLPSVSDYTNLFGGAKIALGAAIEFAKEVAREGLQLASEVSNLSTSVFDSLNKQVEFAEKALAIKDKDFSSIPDTIRSLWDATKLAVTLSAEAAKSMDEDVRSDAAKYAIAALDVVNLYESAAKAFFGEASLVRDVYPAAIENLTYGIELTIRGISDLRKRITGEMLTEAQASSVGINAALSVISNAGSALKPFGIDEAGKVQTYSFAALDNLFSIAEYGLNKVAALVRATNQDDLAKSVEFSNTAQGIFTNMGNTLGFIKSVAEQPATSVASFDAMQSNFRNFNTALGNSEGLLTQGKSISERMVSIAHGIGNDLSEVARSLVSVVGQAQSIIGGTSAAASYRGSFTTSSVQSFGAQSLPPPVIAPVAVVPSSSNTSQTVIHQPLNFNGNVYLNGEQAPEETRDQVRRAMDQWWHEKVQEEMQRYRSQ